MVNVNGWRRRSIIGVKGGGYKCWRYGRKADGGTPWGVNMVRCECVVGLHVIGSVEDPEGVGVYVVTKRMARAE